MRVEVYQDTAGKWRWRLVSAFNSLVLADSGQGYSTRSNAKRGWRAIEQQLHAAGDAGSNLRIETGYPRLRASA